MTYLVKTPNKKKNSCQHKFELKYPQGSKNPLQVCSKCCITRAPKIKNQSLIPYLQKSSSTKSKVLAYKQSNATLAAVATKVARYKATTNWNTIKYGKFKLPATRSKYSWCGIWIILGCLNYKLHQMLGKGNRVYIKQYKRSCYRSSCEICFVKWIAREAERARRRIEKYAKIHHGIEPIHLMLLPPPSQFYLPYEKLKERMMKILDIAEWKGGAIIFHPFKLRGNWYVAPHFHLVGYGSTTKLRKAYGKYGWYLKDAGKRESVFGTFCYLLYHCGIKDGKHSVIWIGELSYRKFQVEKEKIISCCPICEGKFAPISYDGIHPIVTPEKDYAGLVDWDDHWHPS